jgi:flagellar hook-basal body complex protein FliE
MEIGTLDSLNTQLKAQQNSSVDDSYANIEFSKIFAQATKELNSAQEKGYDSMEAIATGKVDNLQEAVMNINKAELSLKLGLEMKTKLVNAYREILKMQV